ncbi:cupin domain-containing protein [Burkholderia cenocepacia]|nr:cupin domain-containing protein [Burkholderia cenocepacia]
MRHHVALSVVGTDRLQQSAYFRGKIIQENLIREAGVPYTIVRSTQFFEFVGVVAMDRVDRADAFVYVVEGSIVMQVKGGEPVTLKPGQTFYEGPNDLHTVGRNASRTLPAKFIVLLLKDKGAPVLVPEK